MSAPLLPVRPRPRHEESFSSYLFRIAQVFSLPVRQFVGSVEAFSEYPTFGRSDCDQMLAPDLIARFSSSLGLPPDILQKTSLVPFRQIFQGERESEIRRWLLPKPPLSMGKASHFSNSDFQGGGQYCPLCLDEPDPYLRISWRFSFVAVCSLHNRILSDRCPHCAAPVDTVKPAGFMDLTSSHLHLRCMFCKRDLRGGSLDKIDGLSSKSMQSILQQQEVHLSLVLDYCKEFQPLANYFAILRWALSSQLLNWNWELRRAKSEVFWMPQAPVRFLREVTEDYEVADCGPHRERGCFRSLTTLTRAKLLSNCAQMLGRWPLNLKELVTHFAGIRSSLGDPRANLPEWFTSALVCRSEKKNSSLTKFSLAQNLILNVRSTSGTQDLRPQICADLRPRTAQYDRSLGIRRPNAR
jgi:hypothetical protein